MRQRKDGSWHISSANEAYQLARITGFDRDEDDISHEISHLKGKMLGRHNEIGFLNREQQHGILTIDPARAEQAKRALIDIAYGVRHIHGPEGEQYMSSAEAIAFLGTVGVMVEAPELPQLEPGEPIEAA